MRSTSPLSALIVWMALGPMATTAQVPPGSTESDGLATVVDADPSDDLPWDNGTVGLFQALQRLANTGSLLQTIAHPDDEQAGVLTRLARGEGIRTGLLVLNRGEAGANAIGPELFDGLGLIRTEELLLAGRYYGLSQVYFTRAVDYGYSKTLGEALRSWDRDELLEDMVRIIRTERPLVVVSRWHGSERDGHGHHHASGVLTPEAVEAAADPSRFPHQIEEEGLRPWRVLRLYRGGVRPGEPTDVVFETTQYSPWLGMSYQQLAAHGLSLQRSQTAGRIRSVQDTVRYRYQRLLDPVSARSVDPSSGFFEGLDLSLSGLLLLTGETGARGLQAALDRAQDAAHEARQALRVEGTERVAPALAQALLSLRTAWSLAESAPEARRILGQKVLDATDALRLALGVTLDARATDERGGAVHRVVGGQTFEVTVRTRAGTPVPMTDIDLQAPPGWSVTRLDGAGPARFRVSVAPNSHVTGAYFGRSDIRASRYEWADSRILHLPWRPSPLLARARVQVGDTHLDIGALVRGEEPRLPDGVAARELQVVPRVSVTIEPSVRVVPTSEWPRALRYLVTVTQAAGLETEGEVTIRAPEGWRISPSSHPFATRTPQALEAVEFLVTPPAGTDPSALARLEAVAHVDAEEYTMREHRIVYPDLEPRSLYSPAVASVRPVSVSVRGTPRVGYVAGVGDEIPAALAALGTPPTTLDDAALREGDLSAFDVIVIGTRAYAVREVLTSGNDRLIEWVREGGHLVLLYQTPEFDAAGLAPYAAELPPNAEEVSEEDATVRFLDPAHAMLTTPNRLDATDFEDWIEQRGSKFFSSWGEAFTPLVETHDTGQPPQAGVWLTAPLGAGHWTYNALALHRQTPYGIPGAYRILANMISYGLNGTQ